MDAQAVRAAFPLLDKPGHIYFDSACTSLKPRVVIEAERAYYEEYSACADRSHHPLADRAEEKFEAARASLGRFVNARPDEVVFTKNATEALNLVVRSLDYSSRHRIVTTALEHHSLLLPILEQRRRGAAQVDLLAVDPDGEVDTASIERVIDSRTALVAIHHTTNTTGMRAPLDVIVKRAHEQGALVLVDGAQGVPHGPMDFHRLGADFLAFSGHKMCGPTGIGCLVARADALERLDTFIVGGGTVETVTLQNVRWRSGPKRFEAGIQNYAGAIGLAAACDYLSAIGMEQIERYERELAGGLIAAIQSIPGATIYGTSDPARRCALVTFNLRRVPAHQVALMSVPLAKIAVRSGVFCAQPAMELLGAPNGAVRASLYLYNTPVEIQIFRETLDKIARLA
jgi:cysteine desulfurase/selenocysteine lyase